MAESEDELKSLLIKVKEESEKSGLELNIQKMKIMASSPITSWQIDGETEIIWGGSKITADGDCSHEIKRLLLLGVFPVVMYGWENWTIKKAESQRIDAFELWCWRRFLRVPWTARRSNQSILKDWKD